MNDDLLYLLKSCTVRIKTKSIFLGTGFFSTPSIILTCFHVIQNQNVENIIITHQDINYQISEIKIPDNPKANDIALLIVEELINRPCVYFNTSISLSDDLYSIGYTSEYSKGKPVSFKYEGEAEEESSIYYQLKDGQALPGLSGSPLLNLRTKSVCGIIKRSRNPQIDLGAYAIPIDTVFTQFKDLEKLNLNYHKTSNNWKKFLLPVIKGAITITDEFKKLVTNKGEERKITPSDFYLAKKDDDCQWYGLAMNWDVERDIYEHIKTAAELSLNEYRLSKIAAIIYGRGGSGKSTLLRRLAWDFANKPFTVLWIKDNEIKKFYEDGLRDISENHSQKKFLILIEDVYRAKQQSNNAKEVFDGICENQNIRLIVCDRISDDPSYSEHIYDPDKNKYELTIHDNKNSLNKILEKIPVWKEIAKKLLIKEDDYKSSLYFILWTIGRTAERIPQINSGTTNTKDLISHFRTLVESDLKVISKRCSGIARMLYYWACIYEKEKIRISYSLFFKLVDLFQKDSDDNYRIALASNEVKTILEIYIHEEQKSIKNAKEFSPLIFNHDILAEDGLSKAKLMDCAPFDDSIKLKMLSEIIENGDEFSASNFIIYCIKTIPENTFKREERRHFAKKLVSKRNYNGYIVQAFSDDFLDQKQKEALADEILSQLNSGNIFQESVVKAQDSIVKALKISRNKELKKKAANMIISQPNFWNLPPQIINVALNIQGNEEIKQKVVNDVLSQREILNFPPQTISSAFCFSENKELKEKVINTIFFQPSFWNLYQRIVITALNASEDKELTRKFSTEILSQPAFWSLPSPILRAALNASENNELKEKVSTEILSRPELWNSSPWIVISAMQITRNKDLKEKTASKILSQYEDRLLPKNIFNVALAISNELELKENAAAYMLSHYNYQSLPYDTFAACLNILENKELKEKVINDILSQSEFWNLPEQIITTALTISENKALKERTATEILARPEFWRLPQQTVINALTFIEDNALKEQTVKEIFSQPEFWDLPSAIVIKAFDIANDEIKEKAACDILFQPNFWNLPDDVVNKALSSLVSPNFKEKVADNILSQPEFWNLPARVGSIAMYISANKRLKKMAAKNFLKYGDWKLNWNITYQMLYFYSSMDEIPYFVLQVVNSVINDFLDKNDNRKSSYYHYKNLMKIPFHSIPVWKKESLNSIKYWQQKQRNLVTNIILSYISKPEEIKGMCTAILLDWHNEITKEVLQNNRNIHYGDHIKLALGHPNLKHIAKEIARQIKLQETKLPGTIPKYLVDIADEIITKQEFPKW